MVEGASKLFTTYSSGLNFEIKVKQKKKSPTTCLEKASNKIVLRIIQLENIEENPIKKYFSESNASFVL